MKRCSRCRRELPFSAFHKNRRTKDGHHSECSSCRTRNRKRRDEHLRYRYGVDDTWYQTMYAQQQGCCAICGDYHDQLQIDHNHTTRRLRALLCILCNTSIGKLKEDPALLRKAAEYIEAYRNAHRLAS